jgi:predicted N-acyltransferase
MRDPGFANAVEDYLRAETEAVDHEIEILTEYGPFRRVHVEEQE